MKRFSNWVLVQRTKKYFYWKRLDKNTGVTVFRATKDKKPPKNEAGYMNLESLMKLKNDFDEYSPLQLGFYLMNRR
jgi:type IV secretory pathway VirB9-like protein